MSFGFSVGDFLTVIKLTTQAYRSWKGACGEYSEITGELNSLCIVLSSIKEEVELNGSLLDRRGEDHRNLVVIIRNCSSVVTQLRDIVQEYEGLGRSRWRNWDRLQLGNKNLGDLRGKLTLHTSCLSTYLNTVSISAIGRVEKRVDELPEMKKAIDSLAADLRAGRKECSVGTTYTNDDRDVWRQFRRELIGEGFSSGSIQRLSSPLKDYLRRLRDQGLLEEEEPHGYEEGRLKDAEGVLSRDTTGAGILPSCDYDEPVKGEGSKVKIAREGHTAHTGYGIWKVETPTISTPAASSPAPGSKHGRESTRDSPPSACKSYSRMDLDQLQLSNTEPEVSISHKDRRGVPLIVEKTESITHACEYCGLSNNVCIRASNRPLGGKRASQSPRQRESLKPIRYNAPTIEDEEDDKGHQEDSDDKDQRDYAELPQLVKPDIRTEMTSQSKNWNTSAKNSLPRSPDLVDEDRAYPQSLFGHNKSFSHAPQASHPFRAPARSPPHDGPDTRFEAPLKTEPSQHPSTSHRRTSTPLLPDLPQRIPTTPRPLGSTEHESGWRRAESGCLPQKRDSRTPITATSMSADTSATSDFNTPYRGKSLKVTEDYESEEKSYYESDNIHDTDSNAVRELIRERDNALLDRNAWAKLAEDLQREISPRWNDYISTKEDYDNWPDYKKEEYDSEVLALLSRLSFVEVKRVSVEDL